VWAPPPHTEEEKKNWRFPYQELQIYNLEEKALQIPEVFPLCLLLLHFFGRSFRVVAVLCVVLSCFAFGIQVVKVIWLYFKFALLHVLV